MPLLAIVEKGLESSHLTGLLGANSSSNSWPEAKALTHLSQAFKASQREWRDDGTRTCLLPQSASSELNILTLSSAPCCNSLKTPTDSEPTSCALEIYADQHQNRLYYIDLHPMALQGLVDKVLLILLLLLDLPLDALQIQPRSGDRLLDACFALFANYISSIHIIYFDPILYTVRIKTRKK